MYSIAATSFLKEAESRLPYVQYLSHRLSAASTLYSF